MLIIKNKLLKRSVLFIVNLVKSLHRQNKAFDCAENENDDCIYLISFEDEAHEAPVPEPTQDEFDKWLAEYTDTPATSLPEGWYWHQWNDGSGHLCAPDETCYFSYDINSGEYTVDRYPTSWDLYQGSFAEFKSNAENYIKKYILKEKNYVNH